MTDRAAIYTRVSTEDQVEGHSLAEQTRRGLELIEREGWAHAGTYEDAGISGALADRPALNRLLTAIAEGLVDVVVVFALDRLARDAGILRDQLRLFDAAGVRVIASGQALDRVTPEGRLQTGILAEFAQFERDKIRDRVRMGVRGRVESGKPWGSYPAYGYARGDDGHWQVNPDEARIVERIFHERVHEGRSYNAIAARLGADGLPTRTGGKWTATVVRRIISGKTTRGYFWHGGTWHEGQHEPIVDEDTWLAAQAIGERTRSYSTRGSGRLPKRHLFIQGMLRCGLCGEAMLPRSATDQADHYVCRSHKLDSRSCPMPVLPRQVVDGAGLALFTEWGLDFEGTRQHLVERLDDRLRELDVLLAQADQEVLKIRTSRERIQRDYESGELSVGNYERISAKQAEQEPAAEAERDRLAAKRRELADARLPLVTDDALIERFRALGIAVGADLKGAAAEAASLGEGATFDAGQAQALVDLAPLRAAIARVFAEVTITLAVEDGQVVDVTGGDLTERDGHITRLELAPKLRSEIVEGLDPEAGRSTPVHLAPDNATGTGVPE